MSVTPRRDGGSVSIDQSANQSANQSGRHVMASTLEAAVLRFEACPEFRGSAGDVPVCTSCGWLEHDHGELAAVRARRGYRQHRTDQHRKAS
jgi:hypothetical protein